MINFGRILLQFVDKTYGESSQKTSVGGNLIATLEINTDPS